MPRSFATTRAATLADVPILVQLFAELRQVGGRAERAMSPVGIGDVETMLTDLIESPGAQAVLACVGNDAAGMAVMRLVRPDPLSEVEILQLAHVVVAPGFRHRGVGRSLVEAATTFAAEHHVEHVAVSVFPSLRDASRFYARLGFAPSAVARMAPVHVLRRRLGVDRTTSKRMLLNGRRGALSSVAPYKRDGLDRR